jgi:uncharacterized protein YutE (UPF0331/DUF86 family)
MMSLSIKFRVFSTLHSAPAREEYTSDTDGFDDNYTRQDAAILNVLRACEQAIDLANYIIRKQKLGIPTSSTESFDLLLLRQHSIITGPLAEKLKKMVHFRNTIIHQYQTTDMGIVKRIIISDLNDLLNFSDRVMDFTKESVP